MQTKYILGALCAALLAGQAPAADTFTSQELATAAKLRDAVRADNRSYRILESLTTEIGPRLAGSPNDARTVEWAKATFKALGYDKVWTEPVPLEVWTRGVEQAEIVAPFPHPLAVTQLRSVPTPAEGITAQVVRFPSLAALKAAPADAARGKIVFIDEKMHKEADYGTMIQVRNSGASETAKKGGVAVVIRSIGTDRHRLPHTGMMRYQAGVPKLPAAAMSNSDADMLAQMIGRGQPVTLKLRLGGAVTGSYTSQNVIGEITGSDKPDEYVLIGAHHDSWDLGTGAVDDGAGVAMMMAAGEAIKRQGLRPKRSIRVVLFADEEQGLVGGKAYLEAHRNELGKIQAASEADYGQGPVIGAGFTVQPGAVAVARQIQQVLAPLGVGQPVGELELGSDLMWLQQAGVAGFGLDLDNADYFNLHHTADDTFDKIEPARIEQATAAYATFAWMAAQSPVGFGSGTLKDVKSGSK